ncbi:hypothetical protein [Pedosphaera parvula]|uniref:Uncharacterized protein n=1 Tax=Pedosphaera parvula (strain Ellin514) TaxID=320771 RepID=B9XLC0_PEDPL|nr:hypothetical protein [Pedosphaera parvula]EEF59323.1 hypothetical protein Cflav_PD1871 [Pedosphaera parvula Ellin514]
MNEEPSGDEFMVLVVSLVYVIAKGAVFYRELLFTALLGRSVRQRLPLVFAPLAGLAILLPVLLCFAAKDIRSNHFYVFLFMTLGMAWMIFSTQLFPVFGLSVREDVVEQGNQAATVALSGALLGILLAYAGGNIGEGPTIWTTIFPCFLASAGLLLLWFMVEFGSRISLAIAEERDIASGWRLASFLVSVGLILGRAVAGDGQSATGTIRDFAYQAWPSLGLALVAMLAERNLRPTLIRPKPSVGKYGLLPGLIYLVIAVAVLIVLGRWK